MWDFRFILTQPVFWVVAVQGLISNLSSYTSDQCVIQRYIATPDENATKRSLWFNGCMSVFAQVVFYGIGMALFAFHLNDICSDADDHDWIKSLTAVMTSSTAKIFFRMLTSSQ